MTMYAITPTGVTTISTDADWKIVARQQTAYGNHVVDFKGRYIEQPLDCPGAWATWRSEELTALDAVIGTELRPYDAWDDHDDYVPFWHRIKNYLRGGDE